MSSQQTASLDELRAQVSRMLDRLDPTTPIVAKVVFQVDTTKEGIFRENAAALARATNKLSGLKFHHTHAAIGTAGQYITHEGFDSVESYRAQWNSPDLINFQRTVMGLVVAQPDLELYQGSDVFEEKALVPRTGQTRCWDTKGNLIGPAGTGHDGEIKAGVEWPAPRLVDNGDGTVTDHLTGLIWLKDPESFGEVTWTQALSNAQNLDSGSCGLTDNSKRGDWRLPNIRELRSLIDFDSEESILSAGHPFTSVPMGIVWTSTTLMSSPTLAWMTTLGIGPSVFDLKVNANRMWPVRGGTGGRVRIPKTGQTKCFDTNGAEISGERTGQDGDLRVGAAWSEPRFDDNGNGTVTDRLTGLTWMKDSRPLGFKTWEQAIAECNSLASGSHGLTDGSRAGQWRLPNHNEIETLVDYGKFGPSLPSDHPFKDGQGNDTVLPTSYWMSTSVPSAPSQAMFIILGVGPIIFENKEHPFLVLPVRD